MPNSERDHHLLGRIVLKPALVMRCRVPAARRIGLPPSRGFSSGGQLARECGSPQSAPAVPHAATLTHEPGSIQPDARKSYGRSMEHGVGMHVPRERP
jgi:hypothetical protein